MAEKYVDLFPIQLDAVVLDCNNTKELAEFYMKVLGWTNYTQTDEEWAEIVSPSGEIKIAFQHNDAYRQPVWPEEKDAQQQMAHLDFVVENPNQLAQAAEHAAACGARLAKTQYGGDKWVTLLDPAGHPFCFVLW